MDIIIVIVAITSQWLQLISTKCVLL